MIVETIVDFAISIACVAVHLLRLCLCLAVLSLVLLVDALNMTTVHRSVAQFGALLGLPIIYMCGVAFLHGA